MKANWWKVGAITVMVIALFLFGRSCGIKWVVKQTKADTVVNFDTIIFVKNNFVPAKVLPAIIVYKKIHDTIEIKGDPYPEYAYSEYPAEAMADYHSQKIYIDSSVNGLTIIDTINMNAFKGRRIKLVNPVMTVTKTEIVKQPKKIIGFIDFSVSRYSAATGLSIKTLRDVVYGFEMRLHYGQKLPQLGIGLSLPIRFKK